MTDFVGLPLAAIGLLCLLYVDRHNYQAHLRESKGEWLPILAFWAGVVLVTAGLYCLSVAIWSV